MKNILKIIVSDIERLSVNVVAIVVIMGLTVIPCLYAWFNILSNWDPYGPEATSNLQVAVASSDEGVVIGNAELNVGDIIITNLKQNTSIGWVFTETADEAIDGVYSGDYYAALVIDEQFTANMISFLSGNIENPVITYYENDKKNAIAPKITGKVKTTIEREVDHAFVSTVAQYLLKGGEYFATLDEQGNITGQGIAKLERLDADMKGLIALLDSYIALVDSTESISTASEAITSSAKNITQLAKKMSEETQTNLKAAKADGEKARDTIDSKVEKVNVDFPDAETTTKVLQEELDKISFNTGDLQAFTDKVNAFAKAWGTKDDANSIYYKLCHPSITLTEQDRQGLESAADTLNEHILLLQKSTNDLNDAAHGTEENFNNAKAVVSKNLGQCVADTEDIRKRYLSDVSTLEKDAMDSAADTVKEIEKLLNYNATSIDAVTKSLDSYGTIVDQSKDSLVKSRDEAVEMERQLSQLIADIKGVNDSEGYQKLMELLKSDPELLSDFISSPVDIADEYIFPVENNGSMTAPFYIVLSIWVGALIMSTILKTTVKNTEGMENLKNWECFFGRFFVTFAIGQIQTVITVLGAFLFVGIQCEHPFYFWLAAAWTSLIYSLLLYSFTYSFGNVGEALSVILMVIQVAGAGGTFPIEVLPKVFQVLYKFMPFNYSMNAIRECIAGFYGNTYRNCMLTLIIYGVIAVVVGVVLYHPFKILNEKIEKSKEKSGILI